MADQHPSGEQDGEIEEELLEDLEEQPGRGEDVRGGMTKPASSLPFQPNC